MIYGSETIILTLESVLPTQEDGARSSQKIWMVMTLIDLIFFSIDFVPSLIISVLSLTTLLLNFHFVHKAEGSFWSNFFLGLLWLVVSAIALHIFTAQIDVQSGKKDKLSA